MRIITSGESLKRLSNIRRILGSDHTISESFFNVISDAKGLSRIIVNNNLAIIGTDGKKYFFDDFIKALQIIENDKAGFRQIFPRHIGIYSCAFEQLCGTILHSRSTTDKTRKALAAVLANEVHRTFKISTRYGDEFRFKDLYSKIKPIV